MNNIIILTAFWNEIKWIKASLDQIEKIDPIEVIICDGCFDRRYPLHSTDGTREVLEEFVSQKDNRTLISPLRYSKIRSLYELFKGHQKIPLWKRFTPARLEIIAHAALCDPYRINQALTFNHMISVSRYWQEGYWFMTYDCDQFYSDETLENFSKTNEKNDLGLLIGEELTFFSDPTKFTKDHQKRNYMHMPHRIYPNTIIVPTRDLVIEKIFSYKHYIHMVKSESIGYFMHYKGMDPNRYSLGYRVGDRKMPDSEKYNFEKFKMQHPAVIKKHFGL